MIENGVCPTLWHSVPVGDNDVGLPVSRVFHVVPEHLPFQLPDLWPLQHRHSSLSHQHTLMHSMCTGLLRMQQMWFPCNTYGILVCSPHFLFALSTCLGILGRVLIISIDWMCTILRYCGIVAMLLYEDKGPECQTCKQVAKMLLKSAHDSVFTELQSLFLSKCVIF